jgi:hypothetical protein
VIVNYYKNNEIKNKNKNIWAENEAEEEVQIYMAKKKSEEEEKNKLELKKEEEKQFQMVIEKSQKENININNNNLMNIINESQNNNNINNINIINSFDESQKNINNINIIKPIKGEEFDENYGICPITLEYMKNPVLTPSGNYYEKSAIIEWIEKNHNDPFSRENLTVDMLVEDEEFRNQIIKYRSKFNK